MQAGKYIRFVSTQELRTHARRAKRRHYRIIARARAPIVQTRERLRRARSSAETRAPERMKQARRWRRLRTSIPALPIFCAYLRGSQWMSARTFSYSLSSPEPDRIVRQATPLPPASVSNRNGAHARRNRIFLHRHHHIFVVGALQTRASAHETRHESSDSAQVIRLEVRRRAASSAPRSPLADWLCHWSTSSPDPQTSPASPASSSPVPPCRGWPR